MLSQVELLITVFLPVTVLCLAGLALMLQLVAESHAERAWLRESELIDREREQKRLRTACERVKHSLNRIHYPEVINLRQLGLMN